MVGHIPEQTNYYNVRCVDGNGLGNGANLRYTWWFVDNSYSATLALCPVIKLTPNIRNDIITVDNHTYYTV